jgi:hypothetical protein
MLSETPADLLPERACLAALVALAQRGQADPNDFHPYGVSAADAQAIPPAWAISHEPSSTRLSGPIDSTSRHTRPEPRRP